MASALPRPMDEADIMNEHNESELRVLREADLDVQPSVDDGGNPVCHGGETFSVRTIEDFVDNIEADPRQFAVRFLALEALVHSMQRPGRIATAAPAASRPSIELRPKYPLSERAKDWTAMRIVTIAQITATLCAANNLDGNTADLVKSATSIFDAADEAEVARIDALDRDGGI